MNPILNRLNGAMGAAGMDKISMIKNMVNGNPNAIYQQLMQTNPQFRQFVQQNQGKSAEQIAQDYGVDLSTVQNLLKH